MRTLAALVATLPGAWQVWTLVRMLAARFAYPFDIEWMEGSHLYHAYRILHGLYLYGDPARGFATTNSAPRRSPAAIRLLLGAKCLVTISHLLLHGLNRRDDDLIQGFQIDVG